MRQINFTDNWNGKLLMDNFTTIRLYYYEAYPDFDMYEIVLRGEILGTAEIVCKKPFPMKQINTQLSLIDCGHEVPWLKQLLKRFHGDITEETNLVLLVFRWRTRNPVPFRDMMNNWYNQHMNKDENHIDPPHQTTLFDATTH